MTLTSAESDFWQRVYASAVALVPLHVNPPGHKADPLAVRRASPAEIADQAVSEWRARTKEESGSYRVPGVQ